MKKLYALFAFFILTQISFDQTDFRFADNSAVWEQCHLNCWEGQGYGCDGGAETYTIIGDTTINGTSYQKIETNSTWALKGCIRKDSTGKVFEYNIDYVLSNSERLIYDFGLNIGDTLTLHIQPPYISGWVGTDTIWRYNDSTKFVVDGADSVSISSVYRKRMFLRGISEYQSYLTYVNDTVIEGIGSLTSAFFSPYSHERDYIPGQFFTLLNFTENNTSYTFKDSCKSFWIGGISETELNRIKINPNPANGFVNIDDVSQATTLHVFDLYGRTIFSTELMKGSSKIDISNLSSGLYLFNIANGKKVGKIIVE